MNGFEIKLKNLYNALCEVLMFVKKPTTLQTKSKFELDSYFTLAKEVEISWSNAISLLNLSHLTGQPNFNFSALTTLEEGLF